MNEFAQIESADFIKDAMPTQILKLVETRQTSKDAGNKVTTITEVTDRQVYHPIVNSLLLNPILPLN